MMTTLFSGMQTTGRISARTHLLEILRVIYQYVFPTSLSSDILLFAFLTVEFLVD